MRHAAVALVLLSAALPGRAQVLGEGQGVRIEIVRQRDVQVQMPPLNERLNLFHDAAEQGGQVDRRNLERLAKVVCPHQGQRVRDQLGKLACAVGDPLDEALLLEAEAGRTEIRTAVEGAVDTFVRAFQHRPHGSTHQ